MAEFKLEIRYSNSKSTVNQQRKIRFALLFESKMYLPHMCMAIQIQFQHVRVGFRYVLLLTVLSKGIQ